MSFETMGNQRHETCEVHGRVDHWSHVVLETRKNGAGLHPRRAYPCNELIVMLEGHSLVHRVGDGQVESCLAGAGTVWTGPAGTVEECELSEAISCLHICLPPTLLSHSALADHGIDPSRVQLAFVGGLTDPLLVNFAQAYEGLMARPQQPTDTLFVDGLTAALAAHLIAAYTVDPPRRAGRPPSLDRRRLARVLDYIDANYWRTISLDDLAAEACLSPFHFARLFRRATGQPPHRYVAERRIRAAKKALTINGASLTEIAVATGFESQSNFGRVFRKSTGMTPSEYRKLATFKG